MTRWFAAMLFLLLLSPVRSWAGANPPPELVQLEREVSLKMAHARGEGYIDGARRQTLAEAEKVDADAEKALHDGEFERAENDLLQAKLLLHKLGL